MPSLPIPSTGHLLPINNSEGAIHSPISSSSSSEEKLSTTQSPEAPSMPLFTPGQCLFCPSPSPSFTESIEHMRISHGLLVPHREHLTVDLETLFRYMHLVIFGYRECICCGTERATVQAVQQHMTGKGHCRFDVIETDGGEGQQYATEFAEFYDFSLSGSEEEEDEDVMEEGDDGENKSPEGTETPKSSNTNRDRRPQLADDDSIRLPSGKIISRQSSAQTTPLLTQPRRRIRTPAPRLEYVVTEDEKADSEEAGGDNDTRILSRREKRERTVAAHQLANLSAGDRSSLAHMSASEQRALLATQHRHADKVQKEERRRQAKIDRKGNKNLYAYWHTETPVYQCG